MYAGPVRIIMVQDWGLASHVFSLLYSHYRSPGLLGRTLVLVRALYRHHRNYPPPSCLPLFPHPLHR